MAEPELPERLLRWLIGNPPTGKDSLCEALQTDGMAIDGAVEALRSCGIELQGADATLRLPFAIDLLDAQAIHAALHPAARGRVRSIEVVWSTDSTNQRLQERWTRTGNAHGHLYLAEFQTAGRGRFDRRWIAPLGGGLCMSLGWRLNNSVLDRVGTLGIAVGVAAMRVLHAMDLRSAGLKWPNDLVIGTSKLGGILLESRQNEHGIGIVIGMGINIDFRAVPANTIDQRYTDLACHLSAVPARSLLAAQLISELVNVLNQWEHNQHLCLIEEWGSYDSMAGKRVRIANADSVVAGIARGIDRYGALQIDCADGLHRFHAGEVSLREDA